MCAGNFASIQAQQCLRHETVINDMSSQFIMDTMALDQHSKGTEFAVGFPASPCKNALSERDVTALYCTTIAWSWCQAQQKSHR